MIVKDSTARHAGIEATLEKVHMDEKGDPDKNKQEEAAQRISKLSAFQPQMFHYSLLEKENFVFPCMCLCVSLCVFVCVEAYWRDEGIPGPESKISPWRDHYWARVYRGQCFPVPQPSIQTAQTSFLLSPLTVGVLGLQSPRGPFQDG